MDLRNRDGNRDGSGNGGQGTTALGVAAAARRVDALFKAMASDFLLREQFVTDPAQILAEYVRGERLDPRRAEDANRLVHAVMSHPDLVRWIRDAARRPREARADPGTVLADFGRAVVDTGASHVVTALIAGGGGILDASVVDVVVDSGIFGASASTEVSGTHMSTGGSGTDPLTESSGTHVSLAATEVSGTHMSTGGSGTDPLTESSGTHVSSGSGALAAVALRALMQYSVELRERGLLDPPGGSR